MMNLKECAKKCAIIFHQPIQDGFKTAIFRWISVGASFLFFNAIFMWIFVEKIHLAVFVATVISAEVCTVLRFSVNEHWVFRTGQHCWVRLGQFHIANGAAFIIWLALTNLLVLNGLHYQLASLAGVACSVGASFLSNFLWVWRKHHQWEELLFWKKGTN